MVVLRKGLRYAADMVETLPDGLRKHIWLPLVCGCLLSGCNAVPITDAHSVPTIGGLPQAKPKVDPDAILSMTYAEAKKISPKNLEVPPFYKIAADEITVLKSDAAGNPVRVRAKGKVFMQVDFREQLITLGQEAYIESGGELIVRGKPLLKRGRTVVEGLTDYTVFYIKGLRLQVIGSHRKATQDASGTPIVMPEWKRSWKEGPNPLLPALSPEDVPREIRASPLLPPADGADETPRMLPPNAQPAPTESVAPREKEAASTPPVNEETPPG
ncbi:MAG TPA: hypothetical protein VK956_14210 [Verrucomicrobium sp.]|nr:hypothetical protein [Verrucomicrobium sp.]